MSTPFAPPSSPSDGIKWADLAGSLLLIEPLSVETNIQTAYGAADAVRANVVVLDGAQAGTEYNDTLIFPKLLQSQVRSNIGTKVLGRLGTGQGKPGQSPPWLLSEANEADQQVGMAWLNRQIAAPAPAQQQPAAQYPPPAAMGQQQGQQWPQQQQPASVPF